MKEIIRTSNAPEPKGIYNQAIVANGFVYVSGQACVNPETNDFALGTIESETDQTLSNIKNILAAAGCSMNDVVKCNVYLVDMADFPAMNGIYQKYFDEGSYPARTTIACGLGAGIKVEIDAIAVKP